MNVLKLFEEGGVILAVQRLKTRGEGGPSVFFIRRKLLYDAMKVHELGVEVISPVALVVRDESRT